MGAVAVSVAVGAVRFLAVPAADDIPAAEAERRRAGLKAALPLRLRPIPEPEIGHAIAALDLPAEQRERIQAAIAARSLRLAWLQVFDSDAEDGDEVTIQTIGLSHTVRLTRRPVAVPVFVPADGKIRITGTSEGLGGGVTLGVVSDGLPVKLPPFAAGQTFVLPVTTLPRA